MADNSVHFEGLNLDELPDGFDEILYDKNDDLCLVASVDCLPVMKKPIIVVYRPLNVADSIKNSLEVDAIQADDQKSKSTKAYIEQTISMVCANLKAWNYRTGKAQSVCEINETQLRRVPSVLLNRIAALLHRSGGLVEDLAKK